MHYNTQVALINWLYTRIRRRARVLTPAPSLEFVLSLFLEQLTHPVIFNHLTLLPLICHQQKINNCSVSEIRRGWQLFRHGPRINLHKMWKREDNWAKGLSTFSAKISSHRFNQPRVQYTMLALFWAITLILTVPPAFGVLASARMSVLGTCVFSQKTQSFSDLLSFNAYCSLSLIAVAAVVIIGRSMVSVYGKRNRVLAMVPAPPADDDNNPETVTVNLPSQNMSRRQKRISKMLLMSFSFSLTCQLPLYLIPLTGLSSRVPELVLCFWILTTVQFAVTPVRRALLRITSTILCICPVYALFILNIFMPSFIVTISITHFEFFFLNVYIFILDYFSHDEQGLQAVGADALRPAEGLVEDNQTPTRLLHEFCAGLNCLHGIKWLNENRKKQCWLAILLSMFLNGCHAYFRLPYLQFVFPNCPLRCTRRWNYVSPAADTFNFRQFRITAVHCFSEGRKRSQRTAEYLTVHGLHK